MVIFEKKVKTKSDQNTPNCTVLKKISGEHAAEPPSQILGTPLLAMSKAVKTGITMKF